MRIVHSDELMPDERALRDLLVLLEQISASPEFVLHVAAVPDRADAVVVRLRNETGNGSWDDEIVGCLTRVGTLSLVQRHDAESLAAGQVALRGFVRPRYHIAWEVPAVKGGSRE